MSDPITLMSSLISILLLLIWIFWLYRDYRVDTFRQKLFELRDELFDDAANGKIDFNAPAYGMLRATINGFIRFAHRMNLLQIIILLIVINYKNDNLGIPFHKRLEEAAKQLPSDKQDLIKNYHIRMNFYTIEYLLLSSPFILLTIIIPVVFILEAEKHVRGLVAKLSGPLDKVDATALATGEIV